MTTRRVTASDSEISQILASIGSQELADQFDNALSPYEPDVLTPAEKIEILNKVLNTSNWRYRIVDMAGQSEDDYRWVLEEIGTIKFDDAICGAYIEKWSAEGPELVFDFKTESGKFRKVKELKKVLRQYQAQMPYTPVTLTIVFN